MSEEDLEYIKCPNPGAFLRQVEKHRKVDGCYLYIEVADVEIKEYLCVMQCECGVKYKVGVGKYPDMEGADKFAFDKFDRISAQYKVAGRGNYLDLFKYINEIIGFD